MSNPICPMVVCLTKYKDKTVQNCDVYIGPTYKNDDFHLIKGIWNSPFPLSPDCSNLNETLKLYEEHVRSKPELMSQINNLTFKILGCFCRKPTSIDMTPNNLPGEICHGDILVRIWKELNPQYVLDVDLWKRHYTPLPVEEHAEFFNLLFMSNTRIPLMGKIKKRKVTKDKDADDEKEPKKQKKRGKLLKTIETHPEGLRIDGKTWPWPLLDLPQNKDTIYLDESGVGCLAGPMHIVAVYLLPGFNLQGVHDSKAIKNQVQEVYKSIQECKEIIYHLEIVTNDEIDEGGIGKAWHRGMNRSINHLLEKIQSRLESKDEDSSHSPLPRLRATIQLPIRIMVDGKKSIDDCKLPVECVVKGDRKFAGISVASIVAKATRDNYMIDIAQNYSEEWQDIFKEHKAYTGPGYPSQKDRSKHEQLLMAGNYTNLHRKSFGRLKEFLQKDLARKIKNKKPK